MPISKTCNFSFGKLNLKVGTHKFFIRKSNEIVCIFVLWKSEFGTFTKKKLKNE
jgi:hypothetical protein